MAPENWKTETARWQKTRQRQDRQARLQILFSSRAIDSLLAIIVRYDFARRRQTPTASYSTIGSSLLHLKNTGLSGGQCLDNATYNDLDRNVLQKRNKYLHQAGQFPTIDELHQFVASTLNGIRVISKL